MTEILSERELVSEGKAIIYEYNLQKVPYTKEDAKRVWDEYYDEDADAELARAAVRANIEALRERYDSRRLQWIWDWYVRNSELREVLDKWPPRMHFDLFFTVRGLDDIVKAKNVSLYSCLMYLHKLELAKERHRKRVVHEAGRKVSVDFGVLNVRKRVREYMEVHPTEVERVKEKYGLE